MTTKAQKAQYQPIQDHIELLAPVWQERLGLGHFAIEHVFLDTYFGDDGEEDFKITATAETRWNYFQAKIKWYMPSAVRHDLDIIERTLVHELCHVLLAVEQTLIDTKLREVTSQEGIVGEEANALQAMYYEHLEMATEMACKAIMAGWANTKNS